MNLSEIFNYRNMSNEQILNLTIREMDELRNASKQYNYEKCRKKKTNVDQLVKEIKRRGLSCKIPLLVRRVFIK